MSTAKNEVVQMSYKNPHAQNELYVPVLVICNTPDDVLENNIRINSAKPLEWLKSHPQHDGTAILVGGGPSIEDDFYKIKFRKSRGGVIFAMNGASQWLNERGIEVDYQCIIDAKEETKTLVDHKAKNHLFGSQVHPDTMDSVENPIVWHLEIGDIENYFPQERKQRGGYVLLGGGAAVGNSALCAAFALGFRDLHVFGFDSCHKDGKSHAYGQDMNNFIPTVKVEWAGREFLSSVAMKAQAEKFQLTSKALKDMGCKLTVHGDGLLQTMYHTSTDELSEKEKYQLMWQLDSYRDVSPGEHIAEYYINNFKPEGLVVDYGCGTGRGSLKIHEAGNEVLLIDFTDNCRDEEALKLPFLQWDLTKPCPVRSDHGFCTDVMEHIPTEDVSLVVNNIMNSSKQVFFQISTIDDVMGAAIGAPLHLTVKPHQWWKDLFISLGFDVKLDIEQEIASLFYIERG